MGIHIGRLIEQRLNELGMNKTEFARRISRAKQNVNDILNRKSVDSELLKSISAALNFDFFQYYSQELKVVNEDREIYPTPPKTLAQLEKELSECKSQLEQTKKEIEYLKKINDLLEKQKKK